MKISTILLAGLAVSCAVPAIAETVSVPVSFAGLDLTSARGKAVLDIRISHAVQAICGKPDFRDLKAMAIANKCTNLTMAATQPRVAIAIASAQQSVQVAAVN
ncbi:UrcA family protein [Sphingomonas sp.]|uniref:UrcA family protein n=1 Tax=Sphingomonas sp. TaxID=28214 RepID=UPI0025D443ED|nr:UrcA family protein [Sphingomonas sp.]